MWKSADADQCFGAPFLQGGLLEADPSTSRLLDPKAILRRAVGSMKSRQAEAAHGIKYKLRPGIEAQKAYIQGNYEEATLVKPVSSRFSRRS